MAIKKSASRRINKSIKNQTRTVNVAMCIVNYIIFRDFYTNFIFRLADEILWLCDATEEEKQAFMPSHVRSFSKTASGRGFIIDR